MVKKLLAVGIILLLVGMSIPSTGNVVEKSSTVSFDGKILYVGGDGPGNYSKIQDAINDSSDGDTVFVYAGYYKEHLIIDKSIYLIGEDREKTIIDGHGCNEAIYIKNDNVTIKSFKIENQIWYGDYGIYVHSNNNTIIDNIISSDDWAIFFYHCHSNTIIGNIFNNTDTGIDLRTSENNIVMNNTFFHCGVRVMYKHQKIVSNNTVNGKPLIYLANDSDKIIGFNAGQIILVDCNNITIQKQQISNTTVGLQLLYTNNCSISGNDLSNNWHYSITLYHSSNNTFDKNTLNSNAFSGIFLGQYSKNNTIIDNNINSNGGSGITGHKPGSNTFIGNNISNNGLGISIGSDKNNIVGNKITENEKGMHIELCDYNCINDNIISNNKVGLNLQLSYYNTITNNNISNNEYGFVGGFCKNSTITSNNISNNDFGISLGSSRYNTISKNTINSNKDDGIRLSHSDYNNITRNRISNSGDGIHLGASNYNTISSNIISGNENGIYLIFTDIWRHAQHSRENTIIKNNFLENNRNAFCGGDWTNTWIENYWNRPRFLPKPIFGAICLSEHITTFPWIIPWFNFDWHPAKEPYDIGG